MCIICLCLAGGARLAGSVKADPAAAAAAEAGRKEASKRAAVPTAKYNELDAIAALIAGAKPGAAAEPELDLSSAIKHENVKSKKQKASGL